MKMRVVVADIEIDGAIDLGQLLASLQTMAAAAESRPLQPAVAEIGGPASPPTPRRLQKPAAAPVEHKPALPAEAAADPEPRAGRRGLKQLREEIARWLLRNGPASVASIVEGCKCRPGRAYVVVNAEQDDDHPWFTKQGNIVSLTPAGRILAEAPPV